MKMLTCRAADKARAFLAEGARPLEQARLAFHLDGADADAVIHELAQFQNADGGFGHGLEPDLRTPASSILATTVGLQVCREIGAPSDHPVVEEAIRYLVNTYNAPHKAWEFIPEEAESSPRADWWNYAPTDGAEGRFYVNPRVEALGWLYDYGARAAAGILDELTASLLDHMSGAAPRIEMHDFLCYLRLAETAGAPEALRGPVIARLHGSIPHTVETDPKAWNGYCTKPLDVAPTPTSLLADEFTPDEIAANLDHLIASQKRDGSWAPPWEWGRYPTAWRQAEREWKGVLTVKAMTTLREYGRVQN